MIDTRPAEVYARGHVPGTLNIPLDESFTTWAGWLLPYDRDVYLLVGDDASQSIDAAVRDLAMIGLDRVAGVFGSDALDRWRAAGRALDSIDQVEVSDVAAMLDGAAATVLDVRGRSEWETGHLPGVARRS